MPQQLIGGCCNCNACSHFEHSFYVQNWKSKNKWINNDLEVAYPQSGSSSTWFLVKLEFGNVGFGEKGKTGVLGGKPLGAKGRTNNKQTNNTISITNQNSNGISENLPSLYLNQKKLRSIKPRLPNFSSKMKGNRSGLLSKLKCVR